MHLHVALDLLDQVLRGHPILLHHDVSRSGHAELVYAHNLAIKSRVLVPQGRNSRLLHGQNRRENEVYFQGEAGRNIEVKTQRTGEGFNT